MENGKCRPKLGAIDWSLYKAWFRERGLCDIAGNSELVARTHEWGKGRASLICSGERP